MGEQSNEKIEQNQLDKALAVPMFWASIAFLVIIAFLMHTVPQDETEIGQYSPEFRRNCVGILGFIYLLIIGETAAHFFTGSRVMKQHILYLLIPCMRLCPRDHIDGTHTWIPLMGWRRRTKRLETYLTRIFSGPMILIALLVLPVVAAEWFWAKTILTDPSWRFAFQMVTAFIWVAFVIEFVVMISVVEKKLLYCKKNWLDLVIIALPFIAFLRAARLGRLIKLQQLSKTAKIYRMRGLALRTWKAIVTLEVIDTLLRRDPSHRVDKLETMIREKEEEISGLRQELEQVHQKIAKMSDSQSEALSESANHGEGNNEAVSSAISETRMRFSYKK